MIHRIVGAKEVGSAFRSGGTSVVAGTELPSMESNRLTCSVNDGRCFCKGGVAASNHCTVSRKYARFSRGLTASMRNGITASPKEKALATSRPTCSASRQSTRERTRSEEHTSELQSHSDI